MNAINSNQKENRFPLAAQMLTGDMDGRLPGQSERMPGIPALPEWIANAFHILTHGSWKRVAARPRKLPTHRMQFNCTSPATWTATLYRLGCRRLSRQFLHQSLAMANVLNARRTHQNDGIWACFWGMPMKGGLPAFVLRVSPLFGNSQRNPTSPNKELDPHQLTLSTAR